MMSRFLAAVCLALCGFAPAATAGVAGNSYSGLLTLADGTVGIASASFQAGTGIWSMQHQFLSDPSPVVQQGRFSETDLFVVSIWQGTLGNRPVTGLGILGTVMTLSLPGRNGTSLGSGIFIVQGAGGTAFDPAAIGGMAPGGREAAWLATLVPAFVATNQRRERVAPR
jgi:hypothetical protein